MSDSTEVQSLPTAVEVESPQKKSGRAIVIWRVVLVACGTILLATGAGALFSEVAPSIYSGIALWLVAGLLVNDVIGALALFGFSVLVRRLATTRGGSRVPCVVLVIVQGALVVGVLVTLVVLPELIHQGSGTANPSVLPLDYAANLVVFHAALVAAAALAILVALVARTVARRVSRGGNLTTRR